MEAKQYSAWQRRRMMVTVMFAGLLSPICSSSYLPAMGQVAEDLATSRQMVDLTITSYFFMMGLAPVVWGSLSDSFGRRRLLVAAGCTVVLSSLGCSLAVTVTQLIILRVLQAVGTSAATVVGYGVIADIYPREERGTAVALYAMGPLLGQLVGPILGGLVAHYASWNYIFLGLSGLAVLSVLLLVGLLPETLLVKKPSPLQRTDRFPFVARVGKLPNPFASLGFLTYAKVLLPTLYSVVLFASFYYLVLSQSNTLKAYALNPKELGLSYIPLGIADIIGALVGGRVSDLSLRLVKRRHPNCPPEARLVLLPVMIVVIMCGMVSLAFLLHAVANLYLILSVLMMICIAVTIVFVLMGTYIMDLFPSNAASTGAAGNLLRILSLAVLSSVNSTISESFALKPIFLFIGAVQVVGLICTTVLFIFRERFEHEVTPPPPPMAEA